MDNTARATHTNQSNAVGGWSAYGPLDATSRAVFEKATRGLVGVKYTPTEVSTQVVAGTNYRFRCNAELVGPNPEKFKATMEIFQPLDGDPTITSITKLGALVGESATKPGGWTTFGPLTPETTAVFQDATKSLLGVDYTPLEVATQVVAGTNYKYICDAKVVAPGAPEFKALVEIFKPLDGKPVVTGISSV